MLGLRTVKGTHGRKVGLQFFPPILDFRGLFFVELAERVKDRRAVAGAMHHAGLMIGDRLSYLIFGVVKMLAAFVPNPHDLNHVAFQ